MFTVWAYTVGLTVFGLQCRAYIVGVYCRVYIVGFTLWASTEELTVG